MSRLRRVAVTVPTVDAELVAATLTELAQGGLEEVDHGDTIELAAYVPPDGEPAIIAVFPNAVGTDVAEGWQDAWRAFHTPITVGGLWIGPPWESTTPGEQAIVIDPGRAFGTGAHPTTRLCVELLARQPRGSLLDVGCGSGVLAIAGARLGFEPITAVDNDPVAVEVTCENARLNGVCIDAFTLDGTTGQLPDADVAVANVLLAPVTEILARLPARRAISSGYLADERPRAPGWEHVDRLEADGWAADVFSRP